MANISDFVSGVMSSVIFRERLFSQFQLVGLLQVEPGLCISNSPGMAQASPMRAKQITRSQRPPDLGTAFS